MRALRARIGCDIDTDETNQHFRQFRHWATTPTGTVVLISSGLVIAGVLHGLRWPDVDTLTVALVAGGLFLCLIGARAADWGARRVASVKVGGVFELALNAPRAENSDEDQKPSATNAAELADEVEQRMRSAARWTSVSTKLRSRRQLLELLARRGFLDRIDAAALKVFFDETPSGRSQGDVLALQEINKRLRISILLRAAELRFEEQGLVPIRPLAPRQQVGFHFAVAGPGSVGGVHVTVVIARAKGSDLAPRRADDLLKIPTSHNRWLISQHRIDTPEPDGVRIIAIGDLPDAISELVRSLDRVPG